MTRLLGSIKGLAAVLTAICSLFGPKEMHLNEVLTTIGNYVLGESDSFRVRIGELIMVLKEFDSIPEKRQKELTAEPLNKLILDFAIKPVRFASQHIEEDERAHEKYFDRMKGVLKLFWPAYQGIQFDGVDTTQNMPKMKELSRLLYTPEKRDGLMLTHFLQAGNERRDWTNRMDQIINHEDVYKNLFELVVILQYFNLQDYKPIHKLLPQVMSGELELDELDEMVGEPKLKAGSVGFPLNWRQYENLTRVLMETRIERWRSNNVSNLQDN